MLWSWERGLCWSSGASLSEAGKAIRQTLVFFKPLSPSKCRAESSLVLDHDKVCQLLVSQPLCHLWCSTFSKFWFFIMVNLTYELKHPFWKCQQYIVNGYVWLFFDNFLLLPKKWHYHTCLSCVCCNIFILLQEKNLMFDWLLSDFHCYDSRSIEWMVFKFKKF